MEMLGEGGGFKISFVQFVCVLSLGKYLVIKLGKIRFLCLRSLGGGIGRGGEVNLYLGNYVLSVI